MNTTTSAGASAGGSSAITILLEWYAYREGYELTPAVAIALTAVLTPLLHYIGKLFSVIGEIIMYRVNRHVVKTDAPAVIPPPAA